jgi:hypothetical protein
MKMLIRIKANSFRPAHGNHGRSENISEWQPRGACSAGVLQAPGLRKVWKSSVLVLL